MSFWIFLIILEFSLENSKNFKNIEKHLKILGNLKIYQIFRTGKI